ncbi:PepSY domain-containing protein [Streptomyces sp. KR80]|uniref:PepSY domain-containing protein n=1 Tax=Streptomyces sp. KR80 TaxID=3457426 RepID=UPI003FD2A860
MATFRTVLCWWVAGLAAGAVLTGCADADLGSGADPQSGSAATSDGGLGSGGSGSGDSGSEADSEPHVWDEKSSATTKPSPGETPKSVLHALTALDTADRSLPTGESYELESERDARGRRVWEIGVASDGDDEYEVVVSEDGTTVLSKREDETTDDDVLKLKRARTTAQQAVRLAYMHRPGEVRALELDTRADGTVVWQVTMAPPGAGDHAPVSDVILNAGTGNVIRSGA